MHDPMHLYSVCLSRRELSAVHAALLDCQKRMASVRGPHSPMTDEHGDTHDAFIQCDLVLRGFKTQDNCQCIEARRKAEGRE